MSSPASSKTAAIVTSGPSRGATPLQLAAGVALVAGVALFTGGMLTSPAQASHSAADYIASLARDPLLSAVSAMLLHYGNVLIGLGILAAPSLVRGVRGSRFVLPGALLTALGFVNTSGELLADWWNIAVGGLLPSDQAVAVFTAARSGPLMDLWKGTEIFALLGALLVYIGLVRAGVLRWWVIVVMLGGVGALFALPLNVSWLTGLIAGLTNLGFVLIGLRLIGRWRIADAT